MLCLYPRRRSPSALQPAQMGARVSAFTVVLLTLAMLVGSASGSDRAAMPHAGSATSAPSKGRKSRPIHWTESKRFPRADD